MKEEKELDQYPDLDSNPGIPTKASNPPELLSRSGLQMIQSDAGIGDSWIWVWFQENPNVVRVTRFIFNSLIQCQTNYFPSLWHSCKRGYLLAAWSRV